MAAEESSERRLRMVHVPEQASLPVLIGRLVADMGARGWDAVRQTVFRPRVRTFNALHDF